ncbi:MULTISPECIES: serine/threonine-protein kinase [unclassified Coleofasciculus]|uniref:serine/threonine-protein kinase n=1 Tax=unclassified Coleofasciculus TaxID=2692782 RepID=UPI00187EA70D|nr:MULTISPECIES: serine/threonine-protein kinase [unclassified Coleofasciculus]MBE9129807.1 serine/threonine protein kinase [Coleofasciculus sp. LEGE 07081]MBE9149192.1 serine/threonine protein kinase [Coleofasciculus sp. LEGE 07092]
MNFALGNLSSFHSEVLQQTQLGQLCSQNELFQDRYEIMRMLGRGGFGVTFLAKDVSLPGQPLCVIKQLCPKVSDPNALANARNRFEREAKILGKLGSHSQIPMLLNYFSINEEFYLVQEYVRGATLARLVRRCGCLSETGVRQFLCEILPLLEYIHRHQVIHRDIKPQNIIRCQDDGRLVLIDFGAVKEQLAQASDSSMKMPSTHFIGTVGFAPPEQFSLRPVFGSDIYALGITCFFLLTGKAPLDFDSDRQTGDIYWENLVHLSKPFAQVLRKMTEVSLSKRYQSASPILQDLGYTSPRDNLGQYLVARQQQSHSITVNESESSRSGYRSPTAKAAIAIRGWRQRIEQKQQRRYTPPSQRLISSSNNSV